MKDLEDVLTKIENAYGKQKSDIDYKFAILLTKLEKYRDARHQDLLNTFLKQNGIESGPLKSELAALELYDVVSGLPEFHVTEEEEKEEKNEPTNTNEKTATPTAEKTEGPSVEFPHLANYSLEKPLLIFGGFINHDKIKWMEDHGIRVEWISNEAGARAANEATRVSERIKRQAFCGVIVLNELMGHQETLCILAACRATNTPYGTGKKGGQGQLRTLFVEFNTVLGNLHDVKKE